MGSNVLRSLVRFVSIADCPLLLVCTFNGAAKCMRSRNKMQRAKKKKKWKKTPLAHTMPLNTSIKWQHKAVAATAVATAKRQFSKRIEKTKQLPWNWIHFSFWSFSISLLCYLFIRDISWMHISAVFEYIFTDLVCRLNRVCECGIHTNLRQQFSCLLCFISSIQYV